MNDPTPCIRPILRWLADGNRAFMGLPLPPGGPRFHLYAEGSERSACENYPRALFEMTWAQEFRLCPRCMEAAELRGDAVPAFPTEAEVKAANERRAAALEDADEELDEGLESPAEGATP